MSDRVVYFIRPGSVSVIKVGYADSLERRLATLQCGNHLELNVLATVPGGRSLEAKFHYALGLGGWRVRNEWFQLCPVLSEAIDGISDGSLDADGALALINDDTRRRWAEREARLQEFLATRRRAERELFNAIEEMTA